MWDKSLLLLIGAVALVAGQSNQYLPPKDAPIPKQEKNYLPPEQAPSQPDNQYLPSLEGEANQGVPSVRFPDQEEQEHHHGDHDHHHEHWDLRESIPGEPGQDYPLHHAPPDTGFSCVGRTTGYYADIASGCQSFHVCSGDEFPPQSFLCPNGTIFNQKVFACEWWTDVDCKTSEEHYSRNSEIGIVPESNIQRKPVKQGSGLLSRPIVVAEPDNDINFQPDSSNDDGTLAYLPPKTETRKPVVPEYNGPPPTTAPKRRPPARTQTEAPAYLPPRQQSQTVVVSPTLPPGLVIQKHSNRPAPVQRTSARTTAAPVQTTRELIRATQAPQRPTLAVQAENAYLPPLEVVTTQKPVVIRTQAPYRPSVQPERPITSHQEYLPPVVTTAIPTTQRIVTTQRAIPSQVKQVFNQQNTFTQTKGNNGYNYQQPIVPYREQTTQRVTTERLTEAPTTQRVTTQKTTQAPIKFEPVTQRIVSQQAFNSFNQIKQQQFSQQNGYNYEKPAIPFPAPTSAPVTQRTTAQRVNTQAPVAVRQPFAPITQQVKQQSSFNQFSQQSFNQQNGYEYKKPVTAAPTIQRATQAPASFNTEKQTFASVTQKQQAVFTQVKQQLSGQQNGYNYEKPSIQFSAEPTTQRPTTQRQTQAPVTYTPARQTFAAVTQRPQQSFNQNQFTQIKQQSFSEQNGYNYQKPSTQFVPTTAAPTTQRVTQPPVTYTTAKQTFAPVTQRPQQSFNQNQFTQIKQQSFSEQNGYNYQKPSIQFTTAAPITQRVTQAPVTYTTARQTFAPVTQRQQQTFNQNSFTQINQQSFNQQNGYNYQKPSTQFVPTTAAPTTQRVTQVPVTYTTAKQTVAPVTQRQQQTFNQNQFTQIKQQSFNQQSGYNYEKPSIAFPAPTTQRPTQAPIAYTTAKQIFSAVTQRQQSFNQNSFTQVKQSINQQNGYNYQKPVTTAPTTQQVITTQRTTQAPFTHTTAKQSFAPVTQRVQSNQNTFTQVQQQVFNQQSGYQYQKPVVRFEQTTAQPATVAPTIRQTFAPVVQTQTISHKTFTPITQVRQQQTFGQSSNFGFSQTKQQSFSQTSGYTYEKPTVTFATQTTVAPTIQRSTTLAPVTYTTVKETFAPITQRTPSANSYSQTFSQNTGYTYDKQTTLPQQTFSQTDGYSYKKPAVSFNTGSSGANLAQTNFQSVGKAEDLSQTLDQAHIRINSLSQSQTQTKVAEETPVVLNLGSGFTSHSKTQTSGSASSDGYSYNSFSHVAGSSKQVSGAQQTVEVSGDHVISVQENKHVVHDSSLLKGTLPPCQHAAQPDPLDEIRSPVSFGPPTPFVAKASSTDEGYHYPKPNIPFITPNNPTLKQAQQGTQFGNQGLYTEVSFGGQHQQQQVNSHHESFIQAFKSASSSNTHSFNSGSISSQQQQQQQGRAAESLHHEFEIVPSISFSYQLNQKKRSADQNAAPTA